MISTQKVARCGSLWLADVTKAILAPRTLLSTLKQTTAYLANHAKRAHLKRDLETPLLALGLGIYPVLE